MILIEGAITKIPRRAAITLALAALASTYPAFCGEIQVDRKGDRGWTEGGSKGIQRRRLIPIR